MLQIKLDVAGRNPLGFTRLSKEEFEAQQAVKEAKWKKEAPQREANKRKRKLHLEEKRLRRDIDKRSLKKFQAKERQRAFRKRRKEEKERQIEID